MVDIEGVLGSQRSVRMISQMTGHMTGWGLAAFLTAGFAVPALAAFGSAVTAVPGHLVASGDPSTLLTNEQRAVLGIKFGPDTPLDFFQLKNGKFYINSAGALGPVQGRGHPAAFNLHVDSQLTRILALNSDGPATGPQDVQTIMTDHAADCGSGNNRARATDPGGAACNQYFDRDYAGGGTYFRCPDNATSVYFYHGENHTAPDGSWGRGGWFGIGVGTFNQDETAVTRARQMPVAGGQSSAQIIGLNLGTVWQGAPGSYTTPPQAHPYNGVPSAIAGGDGYLYVYHGNATLDPASNPSACRPECMGVSRAPIAAFCSAIRTASPVAWQNYNRGSWSEPAAEDATSPLGFGAGGGFSPLIKTLRPGEHGGTVTYLPARHLYVMAQLLEGGIDAHYSSDGINWTDAQPLIDAPQGTTPNGDAEQILYPKIVAVHVANGAETYAVTYIVATKGHFWKWAELMRQKLEFVR